MNHSPRQKIKHQVTMYRIWRVLPNRVLGGLILLSDGCRTQPRRMSTGEAHDSHSYLRVIVEERFEDGGAGGCEDEVGSGGVRREERGRSETIGGRKPGECREENLPNPTHRGPLRRTTDGVTPTPRPASGPIRARARHVGMPALATRPAPSSPRALSYRPATLILLAGSQPSCEAGERLQNLARTRSQPRLPDRFRSGVGCASAPKSLK